MGRIQSAVSLKRDSFYFIFVFMADRHVAKYFFFFSFLCSFAFFSFCSHAQINNNKNKTAAWNPDGLGWRLMPEALRQPFLKQASRTKKIALRSAIVCGVVSVCFHEKF